MHRQGPARLFGRIPAPNLAACHLPHHETAARLLAAAGQQLTAVPQVEFLRRPLSRDRTTLVPTFLPRLPVRQALATISLPLHLNWSQPNRQLKLSNRNQRAHVYEIVLREGTPR